MTKKRQFLGWWFVAIHVQSSVTLRYWVPLSVRLMKATPPLLSPLWLVMPLMLGKMPALLKMHRAPTQVPIMNNLWLWLFCVAAAQVAGWGRRVVKAGAEKEWWRPVQCVLCWFRFAAVANTWCFNLYNWTWRWYFYMEICQPCKWVKTEAGILEIMFHRFGYFFSHWNHEGWSREIIKNHFAVCDN